MHIISEKIRKIRELKGLSQENVSMEIGMSQKAYSNIESGKTSITMIRMTQISKVLGISVEDILHFNELRAFERDELGKGSLQRTDVMIALKEEIIHLRKENERLIGLIEKMSNR